MGWTLMMVKNKVYHEDSKNSKNFSELQMPYFLTKANLLRRLTSNFFSSCLRGEKTISGSIRFVERALTLNLFIGDPKRMVGELFFKESTVH